MYTKCSKKAFDNINVVTGDETWVYYFEPKRKVANRNWATSKEGFVCYFSLIRVRLFKRRGKFYKNVVLRKLKTYYKSRRPKTGLKYVRLLHDNAPAHKAHIVTNFFGVREGYRPSAPSLFARLFSLSKT